MGCSLCALISLSKRRHLFPPPAFPDPSPFHQGEGKRAWRARVRVIVSRARSTQAWARQIVNTCNYPEQRERDIEKRTLRAQSRARRVLKRRGGKHGNAWLLHVAAQFPHLSVSKFCLSGARNLVSRPLQRARR